uniref:Uncharacterized protein n=1 Tax=uncultured Candidatus Melainabacteria bacterium TaxID=2682970 RepID=A0A650EJ00_9BACT|nr:hypothetical protein Melaina855_0570 [uncultured Candidatus Melainabacteria bacterium]
MISSLSNINFHHTIKNNGIYKYQSAPKFNTGLSADTVCFTGKSPASTYRTVFEYLSSELLSNNKKYHVGNEKLSASRISTAIQSLFIEDRMFLPFKYSVSEKIKWKSYIPQDIREFSIGKINEARTARMTEWRNFLKYTGTPEQKGVVSNPRLAAKLREDDSIRLVVWNAITSELKESNRHIPVPFNEKALLETIMGFEKIEPKDRTVRCTAPAFIDMYTHRLRDNLLMDLGLSDNDAVWVKIPSVSHDSANKEKNIRMLEILSCRNWCTRSSVDKAEAALEDGDFYIYLQRGKFNLWEPLVGMTTLRGKIDQIQGVENNNIVPVNLVDEIRSFITAKSLKCHSGVLDEGPKASQALMISEKLSESVPGMKLSFMKAIKDDNSFAIFKALGIDVKLLDDGALEIGTYRPSYNLNPNSGITVPYSMFGLNEDVLLSNVRVIKGNLILNSKNSLYNSLITRIPPNLEIVTGKIQCTAEQYERFKPDIDRLIGNDHSKLIIKR